MKVLITGGSGMLGRKITEMLLLEGNEVAWLSRSNQTKNSEISTYHWDPNKHSVDQTAIDWADAIINLAGESIGETKWNTKGKASILSSRINSVKTLVEALKKRKVPLKSFVGVSGSGYYGPSKAAKAETDLAGSDFPAKVATAWELAYAQISDEMSEKKCIIRLAVVLSLEGGALPKLINPIQFGLGAALGSGLQAFSWIHIDDAAKIFISGLGWDGIFNTAATEKINNAQATKLIAKAMHRPYFLPAIPEFVLQLFLGERSQLVTQGTVLNTQKLKETNYQFLYPGFEKAIANLLIIKA